MSFGKVFSKPFSKTFSPVFGAFLPSDIPGLVAWYDAESGITLNGADVSVWNDRSGNGNNSVQATPSQQPFFDATGIGGKPALDFAGATDLLVAPDSASFNTITGPFSVFLVANGVQQAGVGMYCGKESTTGDGWIIFQRSNLNEIASLIFDGVSAETDVSSSLFTTGDSIFEFRMDVGTAVDFTQNGNSLGSLANALTGVNTNAGAFRIGMRVTDIQPYNEKLSQILVFNNLPSTANRNRLGIYLANRYGLTWNTIP